MPNNILIPWAVIGCSNKDFLVAFAYIQDTKGGQNRVEEGKKEKNENMGRATEKAKEESEVVKAVEKKESACAGFGLDLSVMEELSEMYGFPVTTDFVIQYEERRYCCMMCQSDNDDIRFCMTEMFKLHYKEKHNLDKSSSDAITQLLFVCYHCNKTFEDYKIPLEHRIMHEENYCSYCDIFQSMPYSLRWHMLVNLFVIIL